MKHPGLITTKILTLTEQLKCNKNAEVLEQLKLKMIQQELSTSVPNWMSQSLVWTLQHNHQKHQDKFNLRVQWLRVSVSHYKFSNIRETKTHNLKTLNPTLQLQNSVKQGRLAQVATSVHNNMCRNSIEVFKCNWTTWEKHTWGMPNNVSKLECNNTLVNS